MELLQLDSKIPEEGGAALELDLLLKELGTRQIPETSEITINKKIEEVNESFQKGYLSRKKILSVKSFLLNYLEKNHGLVTSNYYKNMWLPLGMSTFGIPLGVMLFVIFDNAAFIGIGLPIGLMFGSFYGSHLDKKAEKEGRVLKFQQK